MNRPWAFAGLGVLLAVASCAGPGKDSSGGSPRQDKSDAAIQSYIDGTAKAEPIVVVHPNPMVGQYWELSGEGGRRIRRWQVVKVDGNLAIIEEQQIAVNDHSMTNLVIGYQVDLNVPQGITNVTRAWIGKPGGPASEISVREFAPSADIQPTITTERFKGFAAGGGQWEGTVTTTRGGDWEMRTWRAEKGWFDGTVQIEISGDLMILKSWGADGMPMLTYR